MCVYVCVSWWEQGKDKFRREPSEREWEKRAKVEKKAWMNRGANMQCVCVCVREMTTPTLEETSAEQSQRCKSCARRRDWDADAAAAAGMLRCYMTHFWAFLGGREATQWHQQRRHQLYFYWFVLAAASSLLALPCSGVNSQLLCLFAFCLPSIDFYLHIFSIEYY